MMDATSGKEDKNNKDNFRDEFKVTPWEVEGKIDYNKLIAKFGTQPITQEILDKVKKITGASVLACYSDPWMSGRCSGCFFDPFFPGLEMVMQVAIVVRPVRFRHQQADILADRFRLRVSEHPFGGRIEGFERAAGVNDDDAVDGRVDDRAPARVRNTQRIERCGGC